MQSNILKEKVKNTNLKKYGVENVFASYQIKEQIKSNNILKYGVDHFNKTEIGKKNLSIMVK